MSAPPAAAPSAALSYIPEPHEQPYYLALFKAADVQGQGQIGGAEAVQFFSRSKLPVETLKNIWTVSDQPTTNYLDPKKFAVAVRLIQCMQNGQRGQGPRLETPPGIVMRPAMFEGVSGVSVQLPPIVESQDNKDAASVASAQPPPQQQQQPPVPSAGPSSALTVQDPYGMTPADLQRYESIFGEYTKPDGFVYGQEAVALFSKSGMPQTQLAAIWNMVDQPVDNRLDKLEFGMAMHLIVCVSKKNMPMPPQLPPSLAQLKSGEQPSDAGSAVPQVVEQPQQTAPPPAAPEPEQVAPPPTAPQVAMGGMSISDAFEGLDEPAPPMPAEPEQPPQPEPTPSVVSALPEPQVTPPAPVSYQAPPVEQGLSAVPAAVTLQPAIGISMNMPTESAAPTSTPAVAPASQAAPSSSKELAEAQELLQKLKAENISLKAQLSTVSEEEMAAQRELALTVSEIASLSTQLSSMRSDIAQQKARLSELTAAIKTSKENVSMLETLVQEETATRDALVEANQALESAAASGVASAAVITQTSPAAAAPIAASVPAPTPAEDVFGFDSAALPVPRDDASVVSQQFSVASQQVSVASQPVSQPLEAPQQQTMPDIPVAAPPAFAEGPPIGSQPPSQHNRNMSTASAFGFGEEQQIMGGAIPQQTQNTYDFQAQPPPQEPHVPQAMSPTAPAAQASHDMGDLAEMRRKAKDAMDIANEAESNSRQMTEKVSELRVQAEKADREAQLRASQGLSSKKKKGMFGGGKKKKDAKETERINLEAKMKRDELLQAQGQANEAQALAMETRREAERLRKDLEDAEVAAASSASLQQSNPASPPQVVSPAQSYSYDQANGNGAMQGYPAPPAGGYSNPFAD